MNESNTLCKPAVASLTYSHSRAGFAPGRALRPDGKVLVEHARHHNLALVLQEFFRSGRQSRADVARATGLTRVTVSDLVAVLIDQGLLVELGVRQALRPGKPATILDINRSAFQIVGIDLSDSDVFKGAVLDVDGRIVVSSSIARHGSTGDDAANKVVELAEALIRAASAPLLGIGIGAPGSVNLDGVVVTAPSLGWRRFPLQELVAATCEAPVTVANDANIAALAEHTFGGADGDFMLVKIEHRVCAALVLGGSPVFGSHFAAGEIGHVVVDDLGVCRDEREAGGKSCVCGHTGCLESRLAAPKLWEAIASDDRPSSEILAEAGEYLGATLAPIVGALNLPEIVVSGPTELVEGTLLDSMAAAIRNRTVAEFTDNLAVRSSSQGQDIVVRGAAVLVLCKQLGVS